MWNFWSYHLLGKLFIGLCTIGIRETFFSNGVLLGYSRKCYMCHAYTMDVAFKTISPKFHHTQGQIQEN